MKNFSELLAINKTLDVIIDIEVITDNGTLFAEVMLNNNLVINSKLENSIRINTNVDLLSPIEFYFSISGKEYSTEKESAIIIKELSFDNINIIPNYTHCAVYINDHNRPEPTNYLGYNGTWSFCTKIPFYQWLHQIRGEGWLLAP